MCKWQRIYIFQLFIGLCISFSASSKMVFVVDSYHASYPWTTVCRRGLLDNLDPSLNVQFYEMDTKHIDKATFMERADEAWNIIESHRPNLVVTMDDNALDLLGERITDAGIPLVFMGVNNNPRDYFRDRMIPKNSAGILERPLLEANVRLVYQLIEAKKRRILIMMDEGVTSQAFISSTMEGTMSTFVDGTTLDVWMSNRYKDWQAKVNALSGHEYDALIIGSYGNLRDITNQQVPDSETAKWTNKNSAIPMFTYWSHGVGEDKAIGGVVISGYDQGEKAAEAVNDILLHDHYPFVEAPRYGDFLFNQKELDRWGSPIPDCMLNRVTFTD